jgi:CRISPR system Cascade subunit CasE
MTYLTQALIDPDTARELKLWRWDSYKWHKAVWEAFPGRPDKGRHFLTRLDERQGGYRLLVVSPEIPSRPDWCPVGCWQTKPIPETYFGKTRYAFQLRANPTRKFNPKGPDGLRHGQGKRVPLRQREELVSWMVRKGEQGGFKVEADKLRTIPHGPDRFQKHDSGGTHTVVEFQGVLTVTDPPKFHETFTHGIGSAKAFGFGLLVIAPTA